MKQKSINEAFQNIAAREWMKMFPEHCGDDIEIPLVIALAAGIHPYNRAEGYYYPTDNTIVLYQRVGLDAIKNPENSEAIEVIQHELCHSYQHQVLGYEPKFRDVRNTKTGEIMRRAEEVHLTQSWFDAICEASKQLWPELAEHLTPKRFSPLMSERNGGSVRKVQRPGALPRELVSRWPHGCREALAAIVAAENRRAAA